MLSLARSISSGEEEGGEERKKKKRGKGEGRVRPNRSAVENQADAMLLASR